MANTVGIDVELRPGGHNQLVRHRKGLAVGYGFTHITVRLRVVHKSLRRKIPVRMAKSACMIRDLSQPPWFESLTTSVGKTP